MKKTQRGSKVNEVRRALTRRKLATFLSITKDSIEQYSKREVKEKPHNISTNRSRNRYKV